MNTPLHEAGEGTAATPPTFIAYYRLSRLQTKRNSGIHNTEDNSLGLAVQQHDVNRYVQSNNGTILESFQEIESGTIKGRKKRTQILLAIEATKRHGATLVIAKLDRLARDVEFVAGLINGGIDFVCCDNPHATRLTLHILSAVGEDEARNISNRIKKALREKKLRGEPLGAQTHKQGRGWTPYAREMSAIARRRTTTKTDPMTLMFCRELRHQGLSLNQIATRLSQAAFKQPSGKPITRATVHRWLKCSTNVPRENQPASES